MRHAFLACPGLTVTEVIITEGAKTVNEEAFLGCSNLKNVILPESLVSIELSAFSGCSSIASITLPSSVAKIKTAAFSECSNLSSIFIKSDVPAELDYYSDPFSNNCHGRKIYVPYTSLQTYKNNEQWSKYAADIIGYDYVNNVIVE